MSSVTFSWLSEPVVLNDAGLAQIQHRNGPTLTISHVPRSLPSTILLCQGTTLKVSNPDFALVVREKR
jgi:hypothetical protein